MTVEETHAVMRFKSGTVFGKLIAQDKKVELLDKAEGWSGQLDSYATTPKMREIIERADSVADRDDTTSLTIDGERKLVLTTKTSGGVVRDAMSLTEDHPPVRVRFVPRLVNSRMSRCSEIAIVDRLIGMKSEDGAFVRLIANRT